MACDGVMILLILGLVFAGSAIIFCICAIVDSQFTVEDDCHNDYKTYVKYNVFNLCAKDMYGKTDCGAYQKTKFATSTT